MKYVGKSDWNTVDLAPPPLLTAIDNERLQDRQVDFISGIPCHSRSQTVERVVKDISAASFKVCGHESRHGMILQCRAYCIQHRTAHCWL